MHVAITVLRNPSMDWEISIKDDDYPTGMDMSCINSSGVQMVAMGQREMVLGKVYLKLVVFDIYEVVVYTNAMDLDRDHDPDTPWNWDQKTRMQKQDFINHHAGLQNQNTYYLDNEGFNSLLYGAALKVRSEGVHGTATADGPIYYDADNDGMTDSTTELHINQTIPDLLWNASLYPNQVQFTYVPELASEVILCNQPVRVAGSIYQSPLRNFDGTPNWLEMIFATSEENVGSDLYAADIYFDLRWN